MTTIALIALMYATGLAAMLIASWLLAEFVCEMWGL
jgi:hypothetical protein